LLHEQAVRASQHFPIEVPQFVTGLIRPVFRELHGETREGRFVKAGEKTLYDPTSDQLYTAKLSDYEWVE
jgi:hypothetical protein